MDHPKWSALRPNLDQFIGCILIDRGEIHHAINSASRCSRFYCVRLGRGLRNQLSAIDIFD
jgi:hypothetical protein